MITSIFFLTSDALLLLYFVEYLAMYIVDYLSNTLRSTQNFRFFFGRLTNTVNILGVFNCEYSRRFFRAPQGSLSRYSVKRLYEFSRYFVFRLTVN